MSRMILGRKIGMTQIFNEDGTRTPVTVVQAGPVVVVAKKTEDDKEGYNAIKIGFEPAKKLEKDGSVKWRGLSAAQVGVFTKAGIDVPRKHVREFRCAADKLDNFEVGQELDHTMFNAGEFIDVSGISKGKGFSGVMKRHNFRGFKASHGVHESYRGGGSIGASAWPARVFAGTKMAGQMGNERVTVQNLQIVQVVEEDGLYLIKGAVPGSKNALIEIRPSAKKSNR